MLIVFSLQGTARSGRVTISVESKADESFGQTIRQYVVGTEKTAKRGEKTNAPARLQGLAAALIEHRTLAEDRVLDLRYQLLSGVAGTIAAAVDYQAAHAVFLLHEFATERTIATDRQRNAKDLYDFGTTVFDLELPHESDQPWCVGPLPFAGNDDRLSPDVRLYIAKATTDWRPQGQSEEVVRSAVPRSER